MVQVRLSGQTVKGISAIGKGNIQSAFDQLCAIECALSFLVLWHIRTTKPRTLSLKWL